MIITNITDHAYHRGTERYNLDRDSLTRYCMATINMAIARGRDNKGNTKYKTATGIVLVVDTKTHTLITIY